MALSNFQKQFPLSLKKFKKKVIECIASVFFIALLLTIIVATFQLVMFDGLRDIASWMFSMAIYFISIFLVSFIIAIWYIRTYIRTYYYDAGSSFVTIRKGVFTPTEIYVHYQKIQDVYIDQDILDRIMGLYDVHIASATINSGIEAHIDGVDKDVAEGIKNFFLGSIQGKSTNQTLLNQEIMAMNNSESSRVVLQSKHLQKKDISIETFPVSNNWVISKIFVSTINVLWFGAMFLFVAIHPGRNNIQRPIDFFGLDQQSFFYILMVIMVGMIFFSGVYFSLWKRNYSFVFSSDYIIMQEGILNLQERHIPYHAIQDVVVQQNFIDRIFGLKNIFIQNAANGQSEIYALSNGIRIIGQNAVQAEQISQILRCVVFSESTKNVNGL